MTTTIKKTVEVNELDAAASILGVVANVEQVIEEVASDKEFLIQTVRTEVEKAVQLTVQQASFGNKAIAIVATNDKNAKRSDLSKKILTALSEKLMGPMLSVTTTETGVAVTLQDSFFDSIEDELSVNTIMDIMDYGNGEIPPMPFRRLLIKNIRAATTSALKNEISNRIQKKLKEA